MAETQSTSSQASAPTGDIKIFIDIFNKEFDNEIKKLNDGLTNIKNIYADAIKISTPKTTTWPKDESVKTIGDLFKYTFPDIEKGTFVQPPTGIESGYIKQEELDARKDWEKDLNTAKDFFISLKRNRLGSATLNHYNEIKKPGVTNPSLYSPGQYYFDVFMDVVLYEYGPLKNPQSSNGGDAFDFDYKQNPTYGGSVSITQFDPSGEVEISKHDGSLNDVKFDYYEFKELIQSGYVGSAVYDKVKNYTGIDIGLDNDGYRGKYSGTFPELRTQYRSGNYDQLKTDPKFNEQRGDLDKTTKEFWGQFELTSLYKAFIQAGDNYKTIVLPRFNPEPERQNTSDAAQQSVTQSVAPNPLEFTFNIEKTDSFIVVGGSASGTEYTIVKSDGITQSNTDVNNTIDNFEDVDSYQGELDEEYVEGIFAGDEELRANYDAYIVKLETESGRSLTEEEKTEVKNDMVKYKPGKPSKNPPADVIKAMKDYGITTALEQAHFLAQCAHESGQFAWKREFASGKAYEGRTDLGNTQTGDGVRYKGRGYIQITGRANYTAYNKYLKSKSINDDVVANPELLEGKFAADCSVWFWKILGPQGVKNFPKKANEGATEAVVTKISRWVNGGDNGLADRKEKFAYYWSVLEKNASAYS